MSTNGMESWASDLAEVTAIYPFQGAEWLMVIIGVALWLAWHRIQFKREQAELDEAKKLESKDELTKYVERY